MIKILLCVLLAACGAYGWRERRMSPLVGYATPFLASIGIALVINPEVSSRLAAALGVGRGADLIFYLWTVISALLIANVHFRLRYQKELLTILARDLAILSATHAPHGRGSPQDDPDMTDQRQPVVPGDLAI